MRCEIVSSDGMRSSKFTCPACGDPIRVGAAAQYLTDNTFDCTSCFQPLQCLEHSPGYLVVPLPTETVEAYETASLVLDDRVYFDDGR